MKKAKLSFTVSIVLFLIFSVFTILVKTVGVKAVGPENSLVGFADINKGFYDAVGGNKFWYYLTQGYGLLSILVMVCFACLGLYELVKRKSIKAVDPEIIVLGAFYVLVLAVYVFFEKVIINYRPVIEDVEEGLEASYPSSHTVLIITVLASAVTALAFIQKMMSASTVRTLTLAADVVIITAIIGRLLSGVHWLTDIIGGVILAFALVFLFNGVIACVNAGKKSKE